MANASIVLLTEYPYFMHMGKWQQMAGNDVQYTYNVWPKKKNKGWDNTKVIFVAWMIVSSFSRRNSHSIHGIRLQTWDTLQ